MIKIIEKEMSLGEEVVMFLSSIPRFQAPYFHLPNSRLIAVFYRDSNYKRKKYCTESWLEYLFVKRGKTYLYIGNLILQYKNRDDTWLFEAFGERYIHEITEMLENIQNKFEKKIYIQIDTNKEPFDNCDLDY